MRTSPARSDRQALTVPPLSAGGDDASLVRGKARPGLRQNSHRDNAEIGGWEQMMVGLLRLRFAAGVCVLAAGLLMGAGGAVAVADPGSSGSAAHGDDGTNASGQQHSAGAKKPKDEPGGTDTEDGTKDDSELRCRGS